MAMRRSLRFFGKGLVVVTELDDVGTKVLQLAVAIQEPLVYSKSS